MRPRRNGPHSQLGLVIMTSTAVERHCAQCGLPIRGNATIANSVGEFHPECAPMFGPYAELSRLRSENEALKEALHNISLMSKEREHDLFSATQVARTALQKARGVSND